jgi:DNA repair protein RadD
MQLFPDQITLSNAIDLEWSKGAHNVMAVAPTGFGKTVLFSHKIQQNGGSYSAAIAHRQELVTQMALTMARNGIYHRIFAPRNVIQSAVKIQMIELGRNFYNSQANVGCVAVDTLMARKDAEEVRNFTERCNFFIVDEGHHVQEGNKWGRAITEMFNGKKLASGHTVRGLLPTATPCRADGNGLGRDKGGLADVLVRGPELRWLIDNGRLCDYRLISQPSNMDFSGAKTGADGDYSVQTRRAIARDSNIVGCVAEHYLKYAAGKLGVTFAPDLETGQRIADQFNTVGVPAMLVSGDTPDLERFNIVRAFRERKYLQLVNVDLFGEGFDLPAIEVISMARKTESLGVYMQQFGRSLRIMKGKDRAIVIDHVNNWQRHGLPDKYRIWTLEPREKRGSSKKDPNDIPLRECPAELCHQVYERIHPACPFCGHVPEPGKRGAPEFVDGVLSELDPEVLKQLRGEVERIDGPCYLPQGLPANAINKVQRQHIERQAAQQVLRDAIAQWAGYYTAAGETDAQIQKRFYWWQGCDMLTAQALGAREALDMAAKISLTVPSIVV